MKILAIGEIIFDIFGSEAEIGGAPLNFCAHCTRLGGESALISAVGFDELAQEALNRLDEFGVNSSFVQRRAEDTGRCLVTVSAGIPEYNVLRPAAYDKIEIDADLIKRINEFSAQVFAFGTLVQRDSVSRRAVERILSECKFDDIFCDINLRPGCYDRESCLNCLRNATILKISAEEEPLLREFDFYKGSNDDKKCVAEICGAFNNIRLLIFTKGENGSLIFEPYSGEYYEIQCEKAEVVSTVGAGDSYSAAFLCEFFKSGSIEAAGLAGTRRSAFVVAHREAVPSERE